MEVNGIISGGNRMGFLINDVFVHKKYENLVLSSIPKEFDIEFGDEYTGGVFISGKTYKGVFPYGVFELPYGVLADYLFVPNRVQDGCFEYIIYSKYMDKLGKLLSSKDIYMSDMIDVFLLEIDDKSKGTGTGVVSFLRHRGYGLTGFSLSKAHSFWERNGAEFGKNERFIIRRM